MKLLIHIFDAREIINKFLLTIFAKKKRWKMIISNFLNIKKIYKKLNFIRQKYEIHILKWILKLKETLITKAIFNSTFIHILFNYIILPLNVFL